MISGSQLTGSATTYYTAPTLTKAVIKSAQLTNTTAAPISATLYLVPLSGTAGVTNTFISAQPIAVGETYNCPEIINSVIEAGGFVQALGNGLTLTMSGIEIV